MAARLRLGAADVMMTMRMVVAFYGERLHEGGEVADLVAHVVDVAAEAGNLRPEVLHLLLVRGDAVVRGPSHVRKKVALVPVEEIVLLK